MSIATGDRDVINIKIEAVMDSISKTDMVILEKEIDNEDQRELGPLKYLAETTGKEMNDVVNWFLLLIIFVFDPLAIALVVAANMAFSKIQPTVKMSVPDGLEFDKPYTLDEIKEALPKEEPKEKKLYEVYGEDLISDFSKLKAKYRKQSTIPNSEFEVLIKKYNSYGKEKDQ